MSFSFRSMCTSLLACGLVGCGSEAAVHRTDNAPAHVENAQPESALATVRLTPEAEARLGVQIAPIAMQSLGATRTIPGEVIVPQGRAMTISAPFAGIVLAPQDAGLRTEGATIAQGNVVLRLQPLPGADETLRLRADAGFAEQQWQTARQRMEQAREQFAVGQIGEAALQVAESELAVAEAAYNASRTLWSALEGPGQNSAGSLSVAMAAPRGGILHDIHVTPGQAVSPGQPLFDVVNHNVLWVKVPVYAGELRTIRRDAPAEIVPLGRWGFEDGADARPLAGPLTGDTNAAAVDLFYELSNDDLSFRPSERVSVVLPVNTEQQSLVVPLSAIWRDIHGGEWVYQNVAPQTYSRRHVIIARTAGDFAVLANGPPAGTLVATVGVAELAGTEFGVPH